ncbi:MAG: helix-turn-helix domain-containing protein, partial [Shewanella sp.]
MNLSGLETMSVVDAMRFLGICRTTIYNHINSGKIKTVKLGKRRLVKLSSLNEIINGGDENGNTCKDGLKDQVAQPQYANPAQSASDDDAWIKNSALANFMMIID